MKSSKTLLALLVTAGFSSIASAHDYGGTLGTVSTATDKFYISCITGTTNIRYQIRRNSGTPRVQLSFDTTGIATTATTTGTFSPEISVNTTGGAKFFTVKKNPAANGGNSYTVRMHCYQGTTHDPAGQSQTVTYTLNQ